MKIPHSQIITKQKHQETDLCPKGTYSPTSLPEWKRI